MEIWCSNGPSLLRTSTVTNDATPHPPRRPPTSATLAFPRNPQQTASVPTFHRGPSIDWILRPPDRHLRSTPFSSLYGLTSEPFNLLGLRRVHRQLFPFGIPSTSVASESLVWSSYLRISASRNPSIVAGASHPKLSHRYMRLASHGIYFNNPSVGFLHTV